MAWHTHNLAINQGHYHNESPYILNMTSVNYPLQLNLGSGKDFREDFLNVDIKDYWNPDIVVDLNSPFPPGDSSWFQTIRFGTVQITKNTFQKIIALDLLEHVHNLTTLMTSCLELLVVNGEFNILVPYDLSHGAWQDPTHVRAFNEKSWLYYNEWFWYLGWTEAKFEVEELIFEPSELGAKLLTQGMPQAELLRTPRAINYMRVKLRKVWLTDHDRQILSRLQQRRMTRVPPPLTFQPAFKPLPPAIKFAVAIVSPPNYIHQEAFREVAETVHYGLLELGYDSVLTRITTAADFLPPRTHILLGANLLSAAPFQPPANSILYNLEQVQTDSPWFTPARLKLYQTYSLWDGSAKNIEQFARLGITAVQLVPIGYVPQLSRIPNDPVEDIDVLFYGSLNPRRRQIIEALTAAGIQVETVFGVYGQDRDQLIARAKIVLNIHFYETKLFEMVRVSYLLANRKFVISESGNEPAEEATWATGIVFTDYNQLVTNCLNYLTRPLERRQIAHQGFNLIIQRSESNYLKPAIQHLLAQVSL